MARPLLVASHMEITSHAGAVRKVVTATETHLEKLQRLLAIADREGEDQISDRLAFQVRIEFGELARSFDADLRASGDVVLVARVREALMPLMRRAENGWRWYEKPRGYAGDFATITRMYDDEPRGRTAVDRLIDRCFLDLPAVIAVQNRRSLLTREIARTLRARGDDGPVRVTSLACGPAREVFDSYARLDDTRALEATLVDFDRDALAYCRAECTAYDLEERMTLVEANLIHVAVGRRTLAMQPQDLVYTVGLIDYLQDDLVVALLDWIHGTLRPDGRVILGNFHPSNPARAVMDHVLDWKLIHRDEADMHRLARRSKFRSDFSNIMFEDQRINLFAELRARTA